MMTMMMMMMISGAKKITITHSLKKTTETKSELKKNNGTAELLIQDLLIETLKLNLITREAVVAYRLRECLVIIR